MMKPTDHFARALALFLFVLGFAPAQTGVLFASDPLFGQIVTIERTTGAFTPIGNPGTGLVLTCLAHDSVQDVIYGGTPANSLYTVDQGTGLATLVGPVGAVLNGLAFDPNTGVLYGADLFSNLLLSIDPVTGVGTPIGPMTGAMSIQGLGFDPATSTLYGIDQLQNRIFTIDTTTGAATPLPNALPVVATWNGLDYDPELQMLWATTSIPGSLYGVDPATGIGTLVGTTTFSAQGLAFKNPVPPPPEFQVNQPGASLDVGGVQGTSFVPAFSLLGVGVLAFMNLASTNAGMPWDIAVGTAPLLPATMGGISITGQIFNLDLADPTLAFVFGGFSSPGFANVAIPVSFAAPGGLNAQMAVVDPLAAIGVSLSQPAQIVIQ